MIKFEAGFKDILKLIILGVVLYSLSQVINILAIVFVSIILTSSINPLIDYFEAKKVPRQLTILSLVIVSGLLIYIGLESVLPNLITEISSFIKFIPEALQRSAESLKLDNYLNSNNLNDESNRLNNQFIQYTDGLTADIIKFGFDVVGGLFSFITMIIITFYLLVDHGVIKEFFLDFAEPHDQSKFSKLWDTVEHKLGVWLRGQLFVMLIIGVVTYIGLLAIGVKLALPLAIIAGVLEIVPIIGPLISAIPAIIVAFASVPPGESPAIAVLTVVVLYFIIQQLEAVFVVPKVMNQAVGLNPIVIILGVNIGTQLGSKIGIGGPMGALLSVPVAAVLYIGLQEWRKDQFKKHIKIPPSTPIEPTLLIDNEPSKISNTVN
jgi:predicted PurR-regulated permease PerM